jgi:phage tail-like protein
VSARGRDPYSATQFCVSCKALPTLGFTEVRGLSVAVAVATENDSESASEETPNDRRLVAASMATTSPEEREQESPTLELRRGVSDDHTLWMWLQDWLAGQIPPQDVRICLLDNHGTPVRGWVCHAAIPVRWVGPTLVADRPAVAMETLELAHRGIGRIDDLETCCDGAVSDYST